MHNEACRIVGEDLRYLAFDVNEEGLETAVKGLVTLGVRGFNLTMPVKNAMAGLCDELSPAARIGGAVNTVVNDNGRLIGHTTDGVGFVMSAKAEGVDIAGRRIVQLGAGGAGTAILVQMAMDGAACIDVFNMKDAFWPRVESIVSQLNRETGCHVSLHDLSDMTALKDCMKDATMLVNTTPVGMTRIPGCLIPDASYFNREMVVADVIYEPKETELLRMAREAGLKTFNGLYMLLYQGAAAFRLWTGKDMPVDAIKEKYFSGK
jgi:shikimate dehydrogenase